MNCCPSRAAHLAIDMAIASSIRNAPVVVVLASLVLNGCSSPSAYDLHAQHDGLAMQVQLQPDPPRVGPQSVVVHLHDARRHPIAGAFVQVELRETGISSQIGAGYEDGPGRYVVPLSVPAGDALTYIITAKMHKRTVEIVAHRRMRS